MIRYAQKNDLEQLRKLDQHLAPSELEQCIRDDRVLVLIRQELVGCLRYNLFWDNLPFMNLLFLAEDERGKGYGTQLIQFWEEEMRRQQHRSVMTSTRSDKQAQFFYRKHGYVDCGALLLHDEPLEILLSKRLPG